MPKWTDQQRDAIADRGHSLIVCAAAGSGKTAVLVERIVQLVREGCPIENMLVVTFTNAAAGEMRQRIGEALSRAAREEPALGEQVMALSRASISTLHRFCGSLLREHFQALVIDPGFRIGDEQECGVLSRQAMEDAIYSCYEVGSDAFLAADRCYAQEELGELALELHRFMMTRPDPWAFLARAQKTVRMTGEDFERSPAAGLLADFARRRLERLCANARETLALCEGENGPLHYVAACGTDVRLTADLAAAAAEGYTALHDALHGVTFAALGRKKKTDLFDEDIADRVKARRDALKKAVGELQTAFGLTMAEAAADIRMTAAPLDGLAELAKTYDTLYTAAKRQRGLMDFDDLEHSALAALELPEVRSALRERYRYVFIDEYQDSSAIQEAIVGSFAREDGLFLVGDVKQSIYRFRLAEPGIFLEKYRTFADADTASEGQPRRMVLSRNFRSRREVLDVTNFVFGAIMSTEMGEMDYTDQEKLYFGAEYYPPARRDVELHLVSVEDTEEERFDRVQAEARFAARRIRALLDEGFPVQGEDGQTRPVTPEDIVILMRSPSSRLSAFCAALEREGIPCDGGESEDFFAAMEVAVLLSLLEVVDNPRQDVPLIAVLRSPLVGMTPDRLAQIRTLQPDGDYYEALCRDDAPDSAAFLSLLAELRAASREMAADQLLWYIYDRCHASAVFGAMEDGELRLARLHALYDYARRTVQSGKTGLFDFILYLRSLLEKGDAPQLSAASSASGVRIMSVHRSKGLEFPVVVLADLNRTFSRQDMNQPVLVHPQLGAGAERVDTARHIRYDTLSKTALALTLERESKAEEMRILYVALTRAKEKLILVDAMKHGEKHLRELIALSGVPVQPEAVSGAKCPGDWLLLPLLHTTAAGELHQFAELWPQELDEGPEGLTVQLHHVGGEQDAQPADEPAETARGEDVLPDAAALSFRYGHPAASVTPSKVTATQLKGRELDQEIAEGAPPHWHELMPEKPRFMQEAQGLSAAERGTAMHLVMQYLDLSASSGDDVRSQVAALAQRRLLTAEQAASLDIPALVRFLSSPLAERIRRARQVWREYRFALLVDGGIYDPSAAGEELLLQGVADCVFETERGLTVVDFKTDRVTGEALTQRAETYRPQLAAYAAALEKVLEKPVTERILYFFAAGTEISL